jgi:hypothetical protein
MPSHSPDKQSSLPNSKPLTKKASLLSIDPGFRYFGYAFLSDTELLHAGLSKTKSEDWERWTGQPPSFLNLAHIILEHEWEDRKAIIEYPKVHRDTPNPESIVKLAAATGAYTAILQAAGFAVEWVEPRTWKGTVPKEIMCRRILAKLSDKEYNRIENPKDHNIIDAVGIGLWQIRKNRK